MSLINLAERGWLPDTVVRFGIKRLLSKRLLRETSKENNFHEIVKAMSQGPLAIKTDQANDQHYEVPATFFEIMLGKTLKYSCASFENGEKDLDAAESSMLELTMNRARISEGMKILELGCGWGSLTIAMAEKFPGSNIVAVSNSNTQKEFIEEKCKTRGIRNLEVITSDMNDFRTDEKFDRILSVEMFEHMRNYSKLFELIHGWLDDQGKLFFHVFCHKDTPYFFEENNRDDWMAKNFFSGGVMPAFDLPSSFPQHLSVIQNWRVNGKNYAKTAKSWLERIDKNEPAAKAALSFGHNPARVSTQFQRWRLFLMACEELFAYREGKEWFVGHYLCEKT
ncbi:MAG: SAM-dependent methyltransferase [Gammaproteobacteria bacterium]|nr:SAM-dependent methyltransferase [Gammaproteobacteria bacterium]